MVSKYGIVTRRPKSIEESFSILSTILIYVVNPDVVKLPLKTLIPKGGQSILQWNSSTLVPFAEKIALEEGMRFIESGEFLMGVRPEELKYSSDEKINRVKISSHLD